MSNKPDHLEGGFIILGKNLQDDPVSDMPPHFREIWLYLMRKAQQEDIKDGDKTINRGQCIVRTEDVLDDLSWLQGFKRIKYSVSQYKNALSAFVKKELIARTKAPRGTLVTILDYDHYQNPDTRPALNACPSEENKNNAKSNNRALADHSQEMQDMENSGKSHDQRKTSGKPIMQPQPKELPPEYEQIAVDYLQKHMEIYPNLTKRVEKSKIKTGAAAVEKLIRLDGYELDFIRQVVFWAVADDFWGPNLRSLGSLRDTSKANKEIKFKNIVAGWERSRRNGSARSTAQYKQGKDYGDGDAGFLAGGE